MKINEQVKAIAEAVGWTDVRQNPLYPDNPNKLAGLRPNDPDLRGIPDYLGSLEAINEAVASLPYDLQPVYMHKLTFVVMMKEEGVSDFERHLAPAHQRAEAYLRTIDKWEEQP